jgi:hypothetical protein
MDRSGEWIFIKIFTDAGDHAKRGPAAQAQIREEAAYWRDINEGYFVHLLPKIAAGLRNKLRLSNARRAGVCNHAQTARAVHPTMVSRHEDETRICPFRQESTDARLRSATNSLICHPSAQKIESFGVE